jgi:hypothetical protein
MITYLKESSYIGVFAEYVQMLCMKVMRDNEDRDRLKILEEAMKTHSSITNTNNDFLANLHKHIATNFMDANMIVFSGAPNFPMNSQTMNNTPAHHFRDGDVEAEANANMRSNNSLIDGVSSYSNTGALNIQTSDFNNNHNLQSHNQTGIRGSMNNHGGNENNSVSFGRSRTFKVPLLNLTSNMSENNYVNNNTNLSRSTRRAGEPFKSVSTNSNRMSNLGSFSIDSGEKHCSLLFL